MDRVDIIDPKSRKRRFAILRRFGANERGSVAVEFVMLIFPFTLLVFAVIETCISFAAQQVMANVTDDVSRSLRTGTLLPANVSAASLRLLICNQISVLVSTGCPGLVIDLNNYATFGAVPTTIPYTATGDLNEAGFTTAAGGSSAIQSLRVFYRWPIMADFMRSRLSTIPGGKTLLISTMTWRNEPF